MKLINCYDSALFLKIKGIGFSSVNINLSLTRYRLILILHYPDVDILQYIL